MAINVPYPQMLVPIPALCLYVHEFGKTIYIFLLEMLLWMVFIGDQWAWVRSIAFDLKNEWFYICLIDQLAKVL